MWSVPASRPDADGVVNDDGPEAETPPCLLCDGPTVRGTVGLTLLGAPKFTYKVRHLEVSVPLDTLLCQSCGEVRFRARDTTTVRQAHASQTRVTPRQMAAGWRSVMKPGSAREEGE
jgi:hypothetical protein